MDVENAIRTFANAGGDLPREAMRWVLDNWDDAAPGLLGVLERFADGTDRSEEAANAVSFILHLASERRETRVFAPLCRLAKDAETVEAVMGDSATTTLKQIMISTYDGDLDALKGVIEAAETDEFVRTGALEVLAYLMATERVARGEAEAYLLQLSVVALLGSESWSGVIQQAFAHGLISPMDMNHDNFREDLRKILTDPERMEDFKRNNIAAFDDALGELSHPHASSGTAKGDQERRTVMSKGVGRNDPCPCGSGKKYKKCCLQ